MLFARATLLLAFLALVLPQAAQAATKPSAKTLYRDGPSGRYLLDGTWRGRSDAGDQGERLGFPSQRSTGGWSPTTVPRAVNAGDFSTASYLGLVYWFRRDFRLPRARGANAWILRFESVNYRATVWLNGRRIGFNVGSYLPFELPASGLKRGLNRLVLKVDGRRRSFDVPPLSVRGSGSFEGGWWNYTGILREVYLRRVNTLDLMDVFVRPKLRCRKCAARLLIEGTVRNLTRRARRATVSGSFASRPFRKRIRIAGHRSRRFSAKVTVKRPRLWSPERPKLYTAHLKVTAAAGPVLQRYIVHTGIRDLRVNRLGRVELNFREVNLPGASVHDDHPTLGAAIGHSQIRATVGWLRRLGARITRTHYPLNPYFLELCDRKGILVWSEIPVFRMDSEMFNNPTVRAKGLRMLREEILEHRNHPSVAIWSIGNENPSRPKRGFQRYIREAVASANRLDPSRLVGLAISAFPSIEKQAIYTKLDVLGLNDYFGWYEGPHGTTADRGTLSGYLDTVHSDYPHQALFMTEFGAEANRHGPAQEKGTYEFQSDFLAYHLNVFGQKPFINGALVWNLRDFRVKPGWAGGNPLPHPPVNEKGLIDDSNRAKPAFSVVSRIFRRTGPYR